MGKWDYRKWRFMFDSHKGGPKQNRDFQAQTEKSAKFRESLYISLHGVIILSQPSLLCLYVRGKLSFPKKLIFFILFVWCFLPIPVYSPLIWCCSCFRFNNLQVEPGVLPGYTDLQTQIPPKKMAATEVRLWYIINCGWNPSLNSPFPGNAPNPHEFSKPNCGNPILVLFLDSNVLIKKNPKYFRGLGISTPPPQSL